MDREGEESDWELIGVEMFHETELMELGYLFQGICNFFVTVRVSGNVN